MALAIVGGAVLSAALGALFDRAVPKKEFFTKCFRMSKFKQKKEGKSVGQLRERLLSHSLMAIKKVLDGSADVEDMQVLKPEVQKWLNDLAQVLYDVEDFLDEFDGKDLQQADKFLNEVEEFVNKKEDTVSQQEINPPLHLSQISYDNEMYLCDEAGEENFMQMEEYLFQGEDDDDSPKQSFSALKRLFQCFSALSALAAPRPRAHSSLRRPPHWYYEESSRGQPYDELFSRSSSAALEAESSDQIWLYLPENRVHLEEHRVLGLGKRVHPQETRMVFWIMKVERLCMRLDKLHTQMDVLDLKMRVRPKPADKKLPTTAIPNENHLSGRIEALGRILEFPWQNAGNAKKVFVIAIWGMPGLGKTSLAQHVYRDATFNECFDLKAWVCVSDGFGVVRITKMILEAVSEQHWDTDDLNILQETLSKKLSGMTLLLVLDDVCYAKFDSLDALLKPLKAVSKKTVVILTTQHRSVSISSYADVIIQLDLLSHEDCYNIVKTHATDGNEVVDVLLDGVCRDIGLKCNGLPLAAKAAGLLLRSTSQGNWGSILGSDMWNLVDETTDVLPALKLSYQYLPSYLKQCFSYCSLFPMGYEYDRNKLILLWIAEGLVRQPGKGRNIMEEGNFYFDELFSRSFFQRSSNNKSYFVMHDMFHGLAQFVSKQFFSRMEHNNKSEMLHWKIRHLSYERRNCDDLRKFTLASVGHLRTFIALNSPADYFYVSLRAMNDFVPMLKCVRVLSLAHYQIYHLSASVGNLKHLRFLDVSFTKIKRLPGTICKLRKLQILLLSHCSELTELPPDMHRLTALWHLDLSGTAMTNLFLNMPDLSKLRAVGKIVGDPSELHKLRDLKHLQNSLRLSISKGTGSLKHSSRSFLQHFEGLQKLEIDFISASHDSDIQAEVLRLLEPPCVLKNLSIHGYIGRSFPDWVSFFRFSQVVSLHIINCEFCLFFPSFGELPSLEHLHLSGFRNVGRVGAELYGGGSQRITAFKTLKTLIFENMPEWEEWLPWEGRGCDFRCLKELYLRNCPKLSGRLPSNIPSLDKLVISKCPQLNAAPHIFPSIVPDNTGTVSGISSVELSFLPQLRRLPQDIYLLTSLISLVITNIPTIESFPDLPFPKSLVSLRIDECNALHSLPSTLMHIASLFISRCPSLESFPENGLPASLKILKIKHCKSLHFTSFQDSPQKPNLITLEIDDSCDSLGSFALNSFPELSHLKISNCKNLESLCFLDTTLSHDLHLLHVYISECTKLEEISVPEGGLPAPSLHELSFSRCPSLKSVPQDMFKGLTSLESLNMDYCPELRPVSHWHSLPSGLVSLSCTDAIFNSDWLNCQLHDSLTLKHLRLDGLEVNNFPQLGMVPSKVTALTISDFPNLKQIDEGIMSLECLEEFVIKDCPRVASVPKHGFPSSLLHLQAVGCPLLEQDILGEGRMTVAYIPCVIVGYTVI